MEGLLAAAAKASEAATTAAAQASLQAVAATRGTMDAAACKPYVVVQRLESPAKLAVHLDLPSVSFRSLIACTV